MKISAIFLMLLVVLMLNFFIPSFAYVPYEDMEEMKPSKDRSLGKHRKVESRETFEISNDDDDDDSDDEYDDENTYEDDDWNSGEDDEVSDVEELFDSDSDADDDDYDDDDYSDVEEDSDDDYEDDEDLEKAFSIMASDESKEKDADRKEIKRKTKLPGLDDPKKKSKKSKSNPKRKQSEGKGRKLSGLKDDRKRESKIREKDLSKTHCISICDNKEFGCTCQPEAETVDCARARLDSATLCIDSEANKAFHRVSELVLRENFFQEIETDSFLIHRNPAELVELDLSHNQIRHIESGAFAKMSNLNLLDLKFNEIHHIDKNTFAGLKKLLDLDLRANKIYKLTGESFEELESVVQIFLDYNFLHFIEDDAFEGLKKVEHLSLGHTGLTTLNHEWFKDMVSLKSLNLQYNSLKILPDFAGIPSLERLIFSGNGVTKIHRNAFRRLPNLQELHLSRMINLTEIEECAFCHLPDLSIISLADCPNLFLFDRYAFGVGESRQINGLKEFDMRNSSLRTLSADLVPWKNVSSANLEYNQWQCDCDLTWVIQLRLRMKDGPKCYTPKSLRDRLLTSLHHDELHCSLSMSHASKIFVAILIMVLVAGSLIFVWYLYFGNFNGPKDRVTKIFQTRPPLPKYAYRNLAMSAETDEVKLVNEQQMEDKDEDTLYPPPAAV